MTNTSDPKRVEVDGRTNIVRNNPQARVNGSSPPASDKINHSGNVKRGYVNTTGSVMTSADSS
ncbi:hypothetical protein SARC_09341 [Sphaeroforma arctica JP610]|uniref:Uncharacterized protein n=1 Tax=Sphaeroforma arctica JP610 TaxID=667725 RepID=A0A0L0FNB0_9EUKA|nr:hypothetical protein SARC_09341 [Sphaeroforma arctica JP610]KNC78214.1 hypothetical protein SARC_09341 [Sphaeroforma arctica JP610]|eukprot:XP_014152116.1 hypothetical protein SARC_09341 [Sphaeroforma arctica JP610]